MNLSKLTDAMWRKHANPWSGWTRLFSVPLAYIPLWNHSWLQGLLVVAWFVLNPFLFPEPKDKEKWTTRAIQNERTWVKERPLDALLVVQAFGFIVFIVGFYTAYVHKLGLTVISAVIVIACNAWFLNRITSSGEEKN